MVRYEYVIYKQNKLYLRPFRSWSKNNWLNVTKSKKHSQVQIWLN